MLIKLSNHNTLKDHHVTDEQVYLQRRQLIKNGLLGAGALLANTANARGFDFFWW